MASLAFMAFSSAICSSHNADVLSLVNESTLVGEIAAPFLGLLKYWVQTFSDYDVLFAKVIPATWARTHQPVLSRHGCDPTRYTTYLKVVNKNKSDLIAIDARPGQDDHDLFTQFDLAEPAGRLIPCSLRCGWSLSASVNSSWVRVTCDRCG